MAGVLSGDFADLKLYHPLENKDDASVGPSSWRLGNGTLFNTTGARFGNAIQSDATGEGIFSNSDQASLDDSDTAKTLYHCFWQVDTLAPTSTMALITNSGFSAERARFNFNPAGGGFIRARWFRDTDLTPGTNTVEVPSATGKIFIDTPFTLVGFIDAGSTAQGKIFINGVDETGTVIEISRPKPLVTTKRFIVANAQTLISPGKTVDEMSIIQSASLTNAKVVLLVAQYNGTRAFGYNPTFSSVSVTRIEPKDTVVLAGTGFGLDVAIKVDGISATNVVRISESQVSFVVPFGIKNGLLDLAITNTEAGVTFTESNALNNAKTVWSSNGGGTRTVKFGDGIISGTVKVGDPVPFCDPNVFITIWTRISKEPD